MDQSLGLNIRDEKFIFDCRRAIYWPAHKVLLTADLHWGKTQYLRNYGIAISDKVFEADLERLSHLLTDYEVRTLLVLGDLIHHEKALSQGVIHKVAYFRHQHPCELILVKGNHDRYTEFPSSWGIVEEKEFIFKNFLFAHEYKKKTKVDFQFTGHIHPMMRLRAGFDEVRLPSFIISEEACMLPAFSHLTGGQDMKLQKGEKAVVVMEEGLEIFEK
jgi:DNA ligase-associated metallophosphoesterase